MPALSLPTRRRLSYASGYIGLGLLNEASDELEAIEGEERLSAQVMSVRADLYMASRHWDLLVAVARELARLEPGEEKGWVHWAYALRELDRVAEAKAILLQAEPRHRGVALLHYNLACYHSLLGELGDAKVRLRRAFKLDPELKEGAGEDPDLTALLKAEPGISCE